MIEVYSAGSNIISTTVVGQIFDETILKLCRFYQYLNFLLTLSALQKLLTHSTK